MTQYKTHKLWSQTSSNFSQLKFLSCSFLNPRRELVSTSLLFHSGFFKMMLFWRKRHRIMWIPNVELESICSLGLRNFIWGLKNLDMNFSYVALGETLSFHRCNNWGSKKNHDIFRVTVNWGGEGARTWCSLLHSIA